MSSEPQGSSGVPGAFSSLLVSPCTVEECVLGEAVSLGEAEEQRVWAVLGRVTALLGGR